VNYLDTSPFYGRTKSEIVLGRALKGVPRDRFFVSTKVGRYDSAHFDFSAARVTKSIDESLSRLGLDYVDLVICHDIEFADLDQIVNETIPALKKIREETKKFRFIGISGLPLKIFQHILDRTNDVDVVLTYCHSTLLDSSVDSVMDYLVSKGVGIINASPTSMGLITKSGPPAWHPAPQPVKEGATMTRVLDCIFPLKSIIFPAAARQIVTLCESKGVDPTAVALRFSVARDTRIASTLCGMSKLSEVEANVVSVANAALDSSELLAEIQKIVEPVQNVTWQSGKPENN
jgi:L-galactose dehydrogenase